MALEIRLSLTLCESSSIHEELPILKWLHIRSHFHVPVRNHFRITQSEGEPDRVGHHKIGRKREAVSRLFSADDINQTIGTLIELLAALDLTADITLRPTREGEGPMKLVLESSVPYDA